MAPKKKYNIVEIGERRMTRQLARLTNTPPATQACPHLPEGSFASRSRSRKNENTFPVAAKRSRGKVYEEQGDVMNISDEYEDGSTDKNLEHLQHLSTVNDLCLEANLLEESVDRSDDASPQANSDNDSQPVSASRSDFDAELVTYARRPANSRRNLRAGITGSPFRRCVATTSNVIGALRVIRPSNSGIIDNARCSLESPFSSVRQNVSAQNAPTNNAGNGVERPDESACHLPQTFSFGLSHMANICGMDSVMDEVDSAADGTVHGYRVKKELECVLISIMERYGDIAAKFIMESQKNRSSVLGDICEIVQILQRKRLNELPINEIESLLSQVRDYAKTGMKVDWLQERLESMLDAKRMLKQIPALMKRRDRNGVVLTELGTKLKCYEAQFIELKEKREKDAEHIIELKRNLDYYDAEMEKLQKCANSTKEDLETEKGEAETINQIVSDASSKVRYFVEHSLLDDLL